MTVSDPNPLEDALNHPEDAPIFAQPGDTGPELQTFERPPFPPDCPVRPLGIKSEIDGAQTCYYLDANGQLVGLEANNRHGKLGLIALFGDKSDWLEANFPQWSKPGREQIAGKWEIVTPSVIIGFDQAKAARALIEECCRRGIFTAAGKMRGAGAHRIGAGGAIVYHAGDAVQVPQLRADGSLKTMKWADPDLFEGHVYPAGEAIPRPWHEDVGEREGRQLFGLVKTWTWKRELLDPVLFVGGLAASLIGGFLPWRPNLWVTGGPGTGKSTLNGEHGVSHQLLGNGLFRTGNASAAAIRQTLKNSTVPVMFDEIEASDNNRRVQDVIELARVASSGEKAHRGGQDGKAQEFTLRSCFWFSSINIPPLEPQDRSRLAILELLPFPAGAVAPDLKKFHLPELGRKLLRRMIDAVPVLEAVKLKYHAALSAAGHVPRACDQFGTLLACAHVLINDVDLVNGELADDELVTEWIDRCRPEKMAEISEATPDHTACMMHLVTSMVQSRGGEEREALGSWIGKAVANIVTPLLDGPQGGEEKYAERLQNHGLKLVNARFYPEERDVDGKVVKAARWGTTEASASEPIFLAVANGHGALDAIYRDKKWQGGVWKQSLLRTAGAISAELKIGRPKLRAVLVPLEAVLDETELPDASTPAKREAWLRAQTDGGEG